PGASIALPREYPERAAYVVSGAVEAGGQAIEPMRMAGFTRNAPSFVEAATESVVMLLGGETVGGRCIEENFVSSSKGRIAQAKADWRAGRIKLPDLDNAEFTPLAPDPQLTEVSGQSRER